MLILILTHLAAAYFGCVAFAAWVIVNFNTEPANALPERLKTWQVVFLCLAWPWAANLALKAKLRETRP